MIRNDNLLKHGNGGDAATFTPQSTAIPKCSSSISLSKYSSLPNTSLSPKHNRPLSSTALLSFLSLLLRPSPPPPSFLASYLMFWGEINNIFKRIMSIQLDQPPRIEKPPLFLHKMHFSLLKRVKYGQAVYVCGDIPELGCWLPDKAFRLKWTEVTQRPLRMMSGPAPSSSATPFPMPASINTSSPISKSPFPIPLFGRPGSTTGGPT